MANEKSTTKPVAAKSLQQLEAEFNEKLPSYIEKVQNSWSQLSFVNWDVKLAGSLQYYCHKLAGSTGTYGYSKLAANLRQIEHILATTIATPENIKSEQLSELNQKVEALSEALAMKEQTARLTAFDGAAAPTTAQDALTIWIIDDDEETGQFIKALLQQTAHDAHYFSSIDSALSVDETLNPDLIFLDIAFPESRTAGIKAISRVRSKLNYRVPIVMISSRKDLQIRAQAFNSGCDGYLTKPILMSDLTAAIKKFGIKDHYYDKRVLIIEDDRSTALFYQALLKKHHVASKVIHDPKESIFAITNYRPHLIILDNIMPNYSGLEIARIIKQDPSFFNIPIIFVSGDSDFTLPDKTYSLGAKGFLSKPVNEQSLISTVEENLKQQEFITKQLRSNLLSGKSMLYTNHTLCFEHMEARLRRNETAYSGILMINIVNVSELRSTYGFSRTALMQEKLEEAITTNFNEFYIGCNMGLSGVLLFLESDNEKRLIESAQALLKRLDVEQHLDSKNLKDLRLSYCLTSSRTEATSFDALVDKSESLAFKAPENKLVHASLSSENQAATEGVSLDIDISTLLDNKKHYQIAYQPILSMEDQNYLIVDSYIRLQDDSGRLYQPQDFFAALVAKNDFINLDRFVLESSVKTLKSINNQSNRDVFLIIRLSPQTICNRDSLLWMSNTLQTYRVHNKRNLVISFTESDIVKHLDEFHYYAEKLKILGCLISIINFGSTKQSIAIAEAIKPDFIKFNVSSLTSGNRITAFDELLSQVRKSSSATLVATHVETASQLSRLYQHGLVNFQGHFICEPSLAIDLEQRLEMLER